MAGEGEKDGDEIEFIDLSGQPGTEGLQEISSEKLAAIRAALIKGVEAGAFDPLMKQAITGKPLTPEEEKQVSTATGQILKLKFD